MTKKRSIPSSSRPINARVDKRVFSALENENYRFRTIEGVVAATGLSVDEVRAVIKKNPDTIVTIFRKSAKGEELITTRKHYEEKLTLKEKVIGALLNRAY